MEHDERAPADLPEDIAEYFLTRLGRSSTDESLADLPVESGCGDDCKAAIDSAADLISHLNASGGAEIFGDIHHGTIALLIAACDRAVQIYWRG